MVAGSAHHASRDVAILAAYPSKRRSSAVSGSLGLNFVAEWLKEALLKNKAASALPDIPLAAVMGMAERSKASA
jgi:hypothetical protein